MPTTRDRVRRRWVTAPALVAAGVLLFTACGSSDDGSPAPTAPVVVETTVVPDGAAVPDTTVLDSTAPPSTATPTPTTTTAPTTTTPPKAAPTTTVAASGGGVEAPGPALTEADVAALERDLDELDALLQQTELDLQQD